jgi:hypothetical protein
MDPKVNDKFLVWLNKMYGKHGEVKATRGKVHDYLGMIFDYTEPGKVKISMVDYMEKVVDEFPIPIKGKKQSPAPEDLYAIGSGKTLDKKRQEIFHTWVAKMLFACKRARMDILEATALLCTRVKEPNEDDWRKLLHLLEYVNGSRKDALTLSVDNMSVVKWYVDAAFAVHPDFKSQSGAVMTYGQGAIMSMSKKQKLNTRSSTEAELVAVDDAMTLILWTKLFLQAQGYRIDKNILYQNNKSTILLAKNGKKSSTKRTRALNIRYFFVTDQVEKGDLEIEYCPTDEMVADYMTKPLVGAKFRKFKKKLMGM